MLHTYIYIYIHTLVYALTIFSGQFGVHRQEQYITCIDVFSAQQL